MKTEFKKIKEFLIKLLRFLAYRLFLSCLFLFLLSLFLGGLLFYKVSTLGQKIEPEAFKTFQLEKEIYYKVLEAWQEEERKFQEADLKEYPDPFTPLEVIEEKKE